MYVVKSADDNLCSSLMDEGWDSKISTSGYCENHNGS